MPTNKRQHFVPRLLLKKFSKNKITIDLFHFESRKIIQDASIKKQCQEDYYYGRGDDPFEQLENQVGEMLKDCTVDELNNLSVEDIEEIRFFAHVLYFRTVQAAEEANIVYDGMAKGTLKEDKRLKDIDFSKFKVQSTHPQFEVLLQAIKSYPLSLDLEIKFLINEREVDFIISDHPVILCNQWAEFHKTFKERSSLTGLAVKGLKILMPISSRVYLVMYDPTTYSIGSNKNGISKVSKHDVILLNRLQLLNAGECIYFLDQNSTGLNFAQELEYKIKNRELFQTKVVETTPKIEKDGRMSKFIIVKKGWLKIDSKFSFCRVIDSNKYENYPAFKVPIRSPENLYYARQHADSITKQIKEEKLLTSGET